MTSWKDNIDLVAEFHKRFDLPDGSTDCLDHEAFSFRTKFLFEEIEEFLNGYKERDRVQMFDALLDLAYVLYGTALFMGITPEQFKRGFAAVHRANMKKVRASSAGESKRGTKLDVVKPQGWQGPETTLREILK